MKENVVKQESFAFTLRVVKLAECLQGDKKVFVLATEVFGVL